MSEVKTCFTTTHESITADDEKRLSSVLDGLAKSESFKRFVELRAAYPTLDGSNFASNLAGYNRKADELRAQYERDVKDDIRLAYRPQGRQGPVDGGHYKRTKPLNKRPVASASKEPSDSHGFFRYKYVPEDGSIVVKGSSAGVRLGARVQYRERFYTVVGSNKADVYLMPWEAPEAPNAVPGVHKVVVNGADKRPWIDAVGNVYPEGATSPIRIKVPRTDILGAIPWVGKPMRVKGTVHGSRTGDVSGRPIYGNAVDAFNAFCTYLFDVINGNVEGTFKACPQCNGMACPSQRGRFSQRADGRWELSRRGRCPAGTDGPTKAASTHPKRLAVKATATVLRGRSQGRHAVAADPSRVFRR